MPQTFRVVRLESKNVRMWTHLDYAVVEGRDKILAVFSDPNDAISYSKYKESMHAAESDAIAPPSGEHDANAETAHAASYR
jgi:hypothetical protein